MSGIYIHIPFCKQACHYCDFHFSTSLSKKEAMISALRKELKLRKDEFKSEVVETIYFGGGTPSVLHSEEINALIAEVYSNYTVAESPEITLEANPDDLSKNHIIQLSKSPINRLSIGIQSFFEEDLKLMNRAHNASEAAACIREAIKCFDNISIDLIYGIPGMSNERWQQNIDMTLSFNVPHISSYALTVEPKTALAHMIKKGQVDNVNDEVAEQHFQILVETLEKEGFVNYEISNFGKEGYFSKNNSAYWQGKKYLGIGPSAHSFNGNQRGWNVRNNAKYLKAIGVGKLPMDIETLSIDDKYNEYVMTGLRTIWGVSLSKIESEFGEKYSECIQKESEKKIKEGLLILDKDSLKATKKGKFLVDGIAADLFMIKLEE
ncbi:radical SAM family heme chaperone HemW [Maribacter halichondriae]|uniref:radical SAM family heme chaperone HemW n=1 Tax=Maribacter halichondriae TaxID=2980554 RepID=UPI00235A0AF3|nr:radical SAM family heme chaperone HemW [Maribacter sp. Hal144]